MPPPPTPPVASPLTKPEIRACLFFERCLSLRVALCILAGIGLANVMPGLFALLAGLEYASVSIVVAVLIWALVWPMMAAVDSASLRRVGARPKGLVITPSVNWLIKPFTMAALGVPVEVPVMLSLVWFANRTRARFAEQSLS